VAEKFMFDDEVSCVFGKSRLFSGNETVGEHKTHFIKNDLVQTICKPIIEQPSTFFSRQTIEKMGELSKDLHYCMDKEWWIKYLLLYGVGGIREIDAYLVNFRFHNDSKTISANKKFAIDYANILYSLCLKTTNINLAQLISQKFRILEAYEFNFSHVNLINPIIIERMTVVFLLKHARLIFTKSDFNFSKKVINSINFDAYEFLEPEKMYLSLLKERTRYSTWLGYKIMRKLRALKK
jgi:hypothetical protein